MLGKIVFVASHILFIVGIILTNNSLSDKILLISAISFLFALIYELIMPIKK
jgi:hypothetical protein